jgi:hypothetical protein
MGDLHCMLCRDPNPPLVKTSTSLDVNSAASLVLVEFYSVSCWVRRIQEGVMHPLQSSCLYLAIVKTFEMPISLKSNKLSKS